MGSDVTLAAVVVSTIATILIGAYECYGYTRILFLRSCADWGVNRKSLL